MTAARFIASEVKIARETLGWSQQQLAAEVNYSESLVAMVESGRRSPTKDFCHALDRAFGSSGRFDRMRQSLLVPESSPEWFKPWVAYESEATTIRWFEPLLIPGLVQTEEYARALLGDSDRVAARMERQAALNGASLTTIIDESVLHRRIGDPKVMAEQLRHLADVDHAVVQILPTEADTYLGTLGSFAIAVVDGTEVGYVDTPARGITFADAEIASRLKEVWEGLLAETLPRRQSTQLLAEVAERWEATTG